MELTKEKAIDICIELWEWLAETGAKKEDWEGWQKYGAMDCSCPLCEYCTQQEGSMICQPCPYKKKFGYCDNKGQPYRKWSVAKQVRTRKKYARLFLEQLKQLRGDRDGTNYIVL